MNWRTFWTSFSSTSSPPSLKNDVCATSFAEYLEGESIEWHQFEREQNKIKVNLSKSISDMDCRVAPFEAPLQRQSKSYSDSFHHFFLMMIKMLIALCHWRVCLLASCNNCMIACRLLFKCLTFHLSLVSISMITKTSANRKHDINMTHLILPFQFWLFSLASREVTCSEAPF